MAIVKTLNPAGGGDYTLMSVAESTDQQTLAEPYILDCFDGTIVDSVFWDGWNASATNSITVRAASGEGHDGVVGAGFIISHGSSIVVEAGQSYLTIEGIGITTTGTSNLALSVTQGGGGTTDTFENLIIQGPSLSGSNYCVAGSNTARIHYFINNLIISADRGADFRGWNISADPHFLYNNTFRVGGSYGLMPKTTAGSYTYTNNAVVGAGTGDFYGSALGSNNASGDGTAFGAGAVTGVVLTDGVDFVSPSTGDYSPVASPGKLDGTGADLSTEFTTDITGATRTVPWTIGAYIVAGGPPPTGIQEMYIKDGGIFVKYTPYVKVGGTFQEVDAYVLEAGSWVPVHEK